MSESTPTGGPSSVGGQANLGQTPRLLVILAVEDVQRAARFYREAFGWPARIEVPVFVEFALPGGGGVGVYERSAFSGNIGVPPIRIEPSSAMVTSTELYLVVSDLDGTIARLVAVGARLLSPATLRPWGDTASYFADPDGNVIAVARSPESPSGA